MSVSRNRLANCHNRFQNWHKHKRVLCVCSAGLLRSPTMAWVLSQDPYNYNTRAAGAASEYALIPVDEALIEWAEEIVFAGEEHYLAMSAMLEGNEVIVLDIPDEYNYRDDALVEEIKRQYDAAAVK